MNLIKQSIQLVDDSRLTYTKETEEYFRIPQPAKIKFLVDNMLLKLVKYLRNSGIDAAYIKDKDY